MQSDRRATQNFTGITSSAVSHHQSQLLTCNNGQIGGGFKEGEAGEEIVEQQIKYICCKKKKTVV